MLTRTHPHTHTSDVTKLVKIPIRRMRILTFKICRMRMRTEAFVLSFGMQCTRLGQLNHCNNILFPKVNKIGVQICTV